MHWLACRLPFAIEWLGKNKLVGFSLMYDFARGLPTLLDIRNISLFARMPEALLPFAIGWIGMNSLGFSSMHDFVRGFPTLFDTIVHIMRGLRRGSED